MIKLFWNICLLRVGPELVPARGWFVASLIVAHLAVCVLWLDVAMPVLTFPLALNAALIKLVAMAAILWFALYVRQLEKRYPATLGAAVGAETLLMAFLIVAYGVTTGIVQKCVIWGALLWSMVVVGFILYRALSCKPWLGMALSLAITVVSEVMLQAVLGSLLANSNLPLSNTATS